MIALALSLLLQTPAPAEKPHKIERIAVYDLDVNGVEPRVGRIVTDALVLELRKLEGLSVVSMDEVRAMLQHEAQRQTLGCQTGASCVAEIADALGVDAVIVGSIAVVGDESVFGVKRLDQREAAASSQVSRRLESASGDELLAAIGPMVQELYPSLPLLPGNTRGVDERMSLRLNPPPLPVWSTLAVGALGAGLLLTGAACAVGFLSTQGEYKRLAALSVKSEVPGKDLVELRARGQILAIASNVLIASGGAVAVAAGVMVLWTDWSDAGGDE